MEQESEGGFKYHQCLPYRIESEKEALEELHQIVERLRNLHDEGKFQKYEFGAIYALDVSLATSDLMAWQKKKLYIPLDTRLLLTKLFSDACFDAIEPTLMMRYGAIAVSLWTSSRAKQELRTQTRVIDYPRLIRTVRNAVILQSIKSTGLGNIGRVDGLGNLLGSAGGRGSSSSPTAKSSPRNVALSMATTFRCTLRLNDDVNVQLRDEILSFLGPPGHDPAPLLVLEAFCALIPYNDPSASAEFIPLLFELWGKVTPNVAAHCLLPAIAVFAEQSTRRNDKTTAISDLHLNICYQAVLDSLQIPLISTQKSQLASGKSLNLGDNGGLFGSTAASRHNVSSVNSKPCGTSSSAFSKLVVWTLTPEDSRSLNLLDSLVNAIQSFCHPSNVGSWTALIFTALMDVASAYLQRLNSEEEEQVPAVVRLTAAQTARLVNIIKGPVFMGIHSQAPYIFAASLDTLRNLAILSPKLILPSLLGEVYPTLQHGLHQPHRLITSLACLSRMAVPLCAHNHFKMHITTLLELSLPSIDPNEAKRCLLTLALFQAVASVTTFEDCSDDTSISLAAECLPQCVHSLEENSLQPAEFENDAELAFQVAKGATAAYPELLSLYMRRIFELLETTTESKLGSAAAASVLRVLLACSPSIFDRLLEITLEEMLNPQQLSHDSFAQVCGSFIRANNRAFLPIWHLLNRSIREEILENQAGSGRTSMPKDNSLLRYLSVLNMSLLSANSSSVLSISSELADLLRLLREKTNVSVVYTVANTLHHAIAGLVGYSVIFPNPLVGKIDEGTDDSTKSTENLSYLNLKWNVPSGASIDLAVKLFREHIDISERAIAASVDGASSNVQDEDAVTNALIFTRTATGSIAVLLGSTPAYVLPAETMEAVLQYRKKVRDMIASLYTKLGNDNVSGLKEVLFVAKVYLCDLGYERTARLDAHQETLYQFEKRSFKIPGAHKRGLPPAILARRAQLYHHQRLALDSQHREVDADSEDLLMNVVVDACFSAYPAVRRNAYSALYTPLRIFSDMRLYERVYNKILDNIEETLRLKEHERAKGGFSLLKYRSLGVFTVGQFSDSLLRFVELVCRASAVDHKQLSNTAALTFFMLVPDTFRLGGNASSSSHAEAIQNLVRHSSAEPLAVLHWREALFRATSLLALSQSHAFHLNSGVLELFLEGCLVHHPDLRTSSVLGALNLLQKAFKYGLSGYEFETKYRSDGDVEVPQGASQSSDSADFENDWTFLMSPVPISVSKGWKTQSRPAPLLIRAGSQGWYQQPTQKGLWRAPRAPNAQGDAAEATKGFLPHLNNEDAEILRTVMATYNTEEYWNRLFELHEVEPRAEDDRMLRPIALLFRDLVVLASFGYCAPDTSLVKLVSMTKFSNPADLTDKNWHRIASEITCGLMLATPVLSLEAHEVVLASILHTMMLVLKSVSPETLGYWVTAIDYAFLNIDHRRLAPLIDLLEASAKPETSSDGGGFKLSLRAELYTTLMATIGWHRPSLQLTLEGWPKWNHELQTTRESSAETISVAAATQPQISSAETESLVKLFDLEVKKVELSLLHLTLRLLQILGGETCLDLLRKRAFPFLLKYSSVRDEPEIVVLVSNVFAELSVCTFSPASLETVSNMIIESVRSAQWHQRIRMLLFMQSFFFNHLLTLDGAARNALSSVTIDALSDSQAEVRELAAHTLSGIIRCSPSEEQESYVKTLTAKFKPSVGKDVSLIERHAAVLGLGALIGAFPYTSPPPQWIPDLLATLAVRAAGNSGIVGKSTKQVLSDFKKTRQDTWHIDQAAFSQEQLDDLDGVLWKNYFA